MGRAGALPGNAEVLTVRAAESCDLDEMEQRLQAGRCQTSAYARAPRRRRRCSRTGLKQHADSELAAAAIDAIAVAD